MLRSLLQARWPQIAAFTPFVIFVAVLGGHAVASGIAVWVMGLAGWIAGVTVADLGNWQNRTLVPGYSSALFRTVLVVLVLMPLGCALLWSVAGNPLPPYGPGVLAGTLMALWFVRFGVSRAILNTALAAILPPGFYLVWAAKHGLHHSFFETLTDSRVQVSSLALATLGLLLIRHRLNIPTLVAHPGFDAITRDLPRTKLIDLVGGSQAGFTREVVLSVPTVVLALLLVFLVGITQSPMPTIFTSVCLAWAVIRVLGLLPNIHVLLCSYWFSGAVATRRSLGRKCALAILVRGLAWVPAGLLGAATLGSGETQRQTQFDEVLVVLLPTLLAIMLFASNLSRLPYQPSMTWQVVFIGVLSGGFLPILRYDLELGWIGRGVFALCLAGLAVATWFVVARALARAEIAQ